MKRRNQKLKEKNCEPQIPKGAARQDQLLIAGLLIIILVSTAIIGSVLYSWKKQMMREKSWTYEKNIQDLQAQINALKKQVAQNRAGTTDTVANQTELTSQSSSAFEKAVNDKDFTKVEALMAAKVFYVVDASDCCGDITKKEAASHLKNYIRDVKLFNFDQEQQVIKQMKVNLAGTFAKYTIGIADNKMVLSYHLDKQGKVDDIMLSASHLMYDLE